MPEGLQPILTAKICNFALLYDDGVTIWARCDYIRNHELFGINHHWTTVLHPEETKEKS